MTAKALQSMSFFLLVALIIYVGARGI